MKWFHASYFLIHFVINSGNFAAFENTFRDKLSNPLKFYFENIPSVFKMKEKDWHLVRYFPLWLVLPFMVFPVLVILYWVTLAKDFSPIILMHCTVKLLQYLRSFQINLLNSSLWNAFAQSTQKVTCENCCTQTTKPYLARPKKRCSVGTN